MTYRGHVKNGQILLDEPAALPEGAQVSVEIVGNNDDNPSVWDKLLKLAGTVKGLPPDMAENHDHYIHGTPKRK